MVLWPRAWFGELTHAYLVLSSGFTLETGRPRVRGLLIHVESGPRCSGVGRRRVTIGWTGAASTMNEVTRVLSAIEQGDPRAAGQLLPLVYDELRRLAAQRLAQEKPGQTLQATALVHEAYLRLLDSEQGQDWNSRGHFFAAAAEAMRRILVDNARRKRAMKRGGDQVKVELDQLEIAASDISDDVLALDEALTHFTVVDPKAAELVKLRFFAGLTGKQAAEVLDVSPRTADSLWAFARAWLLQKIQGGESSSALCDKDVLSNS